MNTVFVLDDDDRYRELVLLTLEDQCGVAQAVGFGHGDSLLSHFAQPGHQEPDLLVLDLHMGALSGLEVLRRLRAAGRQTPAAFLTGAGDGAERQACLAAGALAVLVKPVAYAELVRMLQQLVASVGNASTPS